jgi:hypothetical protein
MKRVKMSLLVKDQFSKKVVEDAVREFAGEVEKYEEHPIKKEKDVLDEHSAETLMEGAFEFAQGIWMAVKGFGKMSLFAIITIVTGIKWLWSEGVGKKKKKGA